MPLSTISGWVMYSLSYSSISCLGSLSGEFCEGHNGPKRNETYWSRAGTWFSRVLIRIVTTVL